MKLGLLLLMMVMAAGARAQQVTVPELFSMLDWPHTRIDTTLKKRGYILMQKDVDANSSLYQYSNVDRNEEKPTTVRSLAYMDAHAGSVQSRLITYRTYDHDEFTGIASWLLTHGYQTKEKFDFGDQQHTIYSNGKESVRVKVITTKIDGKTFTAYELEIGK